MKRGKRAAGLVLLLIGLFGSGGYYGTTNIVGNQDKNERQDEEKNQQNFDNPTHQDSVGKNKVVEKTKNDKRSELSDSNLDFPINKVLGEAVIKTTVNTPPPTKEREKVNYLKGSFAVKVWFDGNYLTDMNVAGTDIINSYFTSNDQYYDFTKQGTKKKVTLLKEGAHDSDLPEDLKISKDWDSRRNTWKKNYVVTSEGPNCQELEEGLSDYFKNRTKEDESENKESSKMWVSGGNIHYKLRVWDPLFVNTIKEIKLTAGGLSCKVI